MIELLSSVQWKYQLKFSVKKIIHSSFSSQIQLFALSFFSSFSFKMLHLNIQSIFPSFFPTSQTPSLKEIYKSLFTSLPKNKTKIIDKIICIICLASDNFLKKLHSHAQKQIGFLIKKLKEKDLLIKELAYIYMVDETIGYKVGKQSAQKFLNNFLLPDNKLVETNYEFRKFTRMKMSQKVTNNSDENLSHLVRQTGQLQQFADQIKQMFKKTRRRKRNVKNLTFEEMRTRKRIYLIEKKNDAKHNIKYWQNKISQIKNEMRNNIKQNLTRYNSCHIDQKDRNKEQYINNTQIPDQIKEGVQDQGRLPQLRIQTLVQKQNTCHDIRQHPSCTKHESFQLNHKKNSAYLYKNLLNLKRQNKKSINFLQKKVYS